MQDRYIDDLFAASDKLFNILGFAKFEDAMAEMADFVMQIAKAMSIMKNRAATRRWLREDPDPDPIEFAKSVKRVPILAYLIRKGAAQAVKVLPHAPGGRRIKIEPEKHPQIWTEISDLFRQGVQLGIAQRRVAQRYEVDRRTIERIWRKRKKE